MYHETQSGKRIVGKGIYVCGISGKTLLTSLGIAFCSLSVYSTVNSTRCLFNRPDDVPFFPTILLIVLPIFCLALGMYSGIRIIMVARQIDTGVPLTRANTADLPAPDSLVRASAEPAQAQEAVLLRASKETQEKHEEQLLRATVGRQE